MKAYGSTPYPELVVNFCPTGMIFSPAMTPHPADEVIEDSCRALERGAAVVHLHAREANGRPGYRAAGYEKIILGIRGHFPDAIISVSCSGWNFPEFAQRSEVLELTGAARPDLASLTLTSLGPPTGISQNSPEMVIALAQMMVERGIKPELQCFDLGMINAAKLLIGRALLGQAPWCFNLPLGSRHSVAATARHLSNMVEQLPAGSIWSAAGTGPVQLPMNTLALAMGGHCRVGLEDNIHLVFDRGELATNAGLLERLAHLAETFGRPLATPTRARALLGLGASAAPWSPLPYAVVLDEAEEAIAG